MKYDEILVEPMKITLEGIQMHYPNAVLHEMPDGTALITVEMTVGGIDDEGAYLLVLDGPAEGEKCYEW